MLTDNREMNAVIVQPPPLARKGLGSRGQLPRSTISQLDKLSRDSTRDAQMLAVLQTAKIGAKRGHAEQIVLHDLFCTILVRDERKWQIE
jgi:hypothetical protein